MLENLSQLVEAAGKEYDEAKSAQSVLAEKQEALNVAQQEVDAARDTVLTERGEAVESLKAVGEAVKALIAELEPQV